MQDHRSHVCSSKPHASIHGGRPARVSWRGGWGLPKSIYIAINFFYAKSTAKHAISNTGMLSVTFK